MGEAVEKKEFELFASTSPNPVSKLKARNVPFRENISSLYPEDIRKEMKK